jgi:hypothetical protein
MDWSWLQKFSGGLDVIPIFIAIAGIISMQGVRAAHRIETKLAYTLAWICFIALPIAQIGWITAVIKGVPFMGSLLDNVWTIYNFCSLSCILLLMHTMEPRKRKGYED